jgi:hypothetical protein
MNETDAKLQALLAPPDEFPDEIFTARVRRQVLAEAQLYEIRRRSLRRFAVELAGTAAAVAVFVLLGRTGAASDTVGFGPALAGLALIAFWTVVGLRPAAGMSILR